MRSSRTTSEAEEELKVQGAEEIETLRLLWLSAPPLLCPSAPLPSAPQASACLSFWLRKRNFHILSPAVSKRSVVSNLDGP